MLSTLTSKGQVRLPKEIRDRLTLLTGAQLDIELQEDGTITIRRLRASALAIAGLLRRPGTKVRSLEEIGAGIEQHLAEKYGVEIP